MNGYMQCRTAHYWPWKVRILVAWVSIMSKVTWNCCMKRLGKPSAHPWKTAEDPIPCTTCGTTHGTHHNRSWAWMHHWAYGTHKTVAYCQPSWNDSQGGCGDTSLEESTRHNLPQDHLVGVFAFAIHPSTKVLGLCHELSSVALAMAKRPQSLPLGCRCMLIIWKFAMFPEGFQKLQICFFVLELRLLK